MNRKSFQRTTFSVHKICTEQQGNWITEHMTTFYLYWMPQGNDGCNLSHPFSFSSFCFLQLLDISFAVLECLLTTVLLECQSGLSAAVFFFFCHVKLKMSAFLYSEQFVMLTK